MARRNKQNSVNTPTEEENTQMSTPTIENTEVEATEAEPQNTEVEATEAQTENTEAPQSAEAEVDPDEVDLSEFETAVENAVAERDASTGDIPVQFVEPVALAYRGLPGGVKVKNRAKALLTDAMKEAMAPDTQDIVLARAYMLLADGLKSAVARAARQPKAPADPTEAYIEAMVSLQLAQELLRDNTPEGVADDWNTRANELYRESQEAARELHAFHTTDQEDENAEAPEASSVVTAAVKLSLGRSAKVVSRRSSAAGSDGPAYSGPRRDVMKHIAEAFEGVESGTFLKVSQIRAHKSTEYGDDAPSAGAITQRLKSPKWNLEGVEPVLDGDQGQGARKL